MIKRQQQAMFKISKYHEKLIFNIIILFFKLKRLLNRTQNSSKYFIKNMSHKKMKQNQNIYIQR
jgi:hypothetical protein